MKYYVIIDNNILISESSEVLIQFYNDSQLLPDDYVEGKYIVKDGELVPNENYEAEQAQKEKERIGNLTCTKRVFALMLQELGINYTTLKQLIATNEQAQLEWDLCIELERKNPLLDVMALQLGITSEQLDGLFKYANGEISIDEFRGLYVKPEEELPTNEVVEQQGNTEAE